MKKITLHPAPKVSKNESPFFLPRRPKMKMPAITRMTIKIISMCSVLFYKIRAKIDFQRTGIEIN
jgi:hypothetical protein